MSRLKLAAITGVFLIVANHAAAAEDCDKVLLKDVTITSQDTATSLTYLTTLSQSEFAEAQNSAGFTIPIKGIPFGADAVSAQSAMAEIKTYAKLDYNEKDRKLLFTSHLSDNALKAYRACVTPNEMFSAEPRNVSQDSVTIRVRWNAMGGAVLKTIKVDKVVGGQLFDAPNAIPQSGGFVEYLFVREPKKRFLVLIKAEVDGAQSGSIAQTVEVPWSPKISVIPVIRQKSALDPENLLPGGQNPVTVYSAGVGSYQHFEFAAAPGFFIDPSKVTASAHKGSGGACVGPPSISLALSAGNRKISGDLSYVTNPNCGGDAYGLVKWQEVYPLVIVDDVVANPLP